MTPTTSPSPASCCAAPTSRSRTSSPAASPSSASTTTRARALNPRLIYLSISGFGTAEGAWLPGYDLVVQAVSGLMSLTGDPDGPAYRSGISVFDVVTGLHGAIGVLAALRQRDETGRGQHVEVNLLSSALSGLVNQTARLHRRRRRARSGWAMPTRASTRTSRCRRRTATSIITAANDRQFRALCEVLDIPEVADDERFRLNADRTANRGRAAPAAASGDSPSGRPTTCSSPSTRPVCRAGRSTRSTTGVELAERLGLEPRVTVGEGERAVDVVRNPIRFSDGDLDYDLPPPRRSASTATRSAQWLASPTTVSDPAATDQRPAHPSLPHRDRCFRRSTTSCCSATTSPGT